MNPLVQAVGWTLLHFIWQGAVIALTAAIVLSLLEDRSARLRYAVSCASLVVMLLMPAVTMLAVSSAGAPPPSLAVGSERLMPNGSSPEPPFLPFEPSARGDGRVWRSVPDAEAALGAIVATWATGVMFLAVRLAGGWWRVRRLHQVALASTPSRWQDACGRLANRIGLRKAIRVVESTFIDTPAVVGWLKPVIVLPVAAITCLSPAQIEAILAHELAHIRRHDYLVNLAQTLVETLLFYHPAVWWLSARVRTEREYCCDDVAVAWSGDAVGYAAALADLESTRSSRRPLALAATGGSLLDRVGRLLQVPRDDSWRSSESMATIVLTLFFVVGAGSAQLIPTRLSETLAESGEAPASTVAQALQPATPAAPAPPESPAPPATAAATSRPAAGEGIQVRSDGDEFRMRWRSGLRSIEARGFGDMTFRSDLSDIAAMTPGSYLILRDWSGVLPRTIEIRAETGSISRKFYVGGFARPWHDGVQAELSNRLRSLVRRSGFGARSRTEQILAAKGVDGVLEEIGLLETDYARRQYFRELVRAQGTFDSKTLVALLTLAGRLIASDYYLTETLREVAPLIGGDQAAGEAYVEAVATLRSDYEHRRALVPLLQSSKTTSAVADLAMRSTSSMRSDYERAETMRSALRAGRIESGEAMLEALGEMRSDYEKRRALFAFLDDRPMSPETSNGFLKAAATIRSDFECSTVLRAFIRRQRVDPAAREAFFDALRTIQSSFERKQVLTTLVDGPALERDILLGALESVAGMSSDFERSETLLSLVKAQPIDAATRDALVDVVRKMGSDYEQGRVLVALVRSERR
jgi:beta-lactamase regulating signal transducer with metallopeptidase domain